MTRAAVGTLAALVLLCASATLAQVPVPPERPRDIPAPDTSQAGTPPYQVELDRLAELLGTLTLLHDLCPPGDGSVWRGKMQDLLATEGSTPARRDRLAGAFNRGFESYRLAYRSCTPAAELAITRALDEGGRLAGELAARFGGG